jgi:uncharacterized protein (TIGR02996 family)
MGDEEGFLAAIAAEPNDDGLRLIYADWLEERGDARGELVRVCQAMRAVPVWSDRYWELKACRNELWVRCPLEWLEATGYDGGYYDPVFRDGVPDGWRERWRLIREFTERWRGADVPDVGGRQKEVRHAEERLRLELPPSLREYVAYAHDLGEPGTRTGDPRYSPTLFHCAYYQLDRLRFHPAVGLINFTLDDSCLGVALEDLDDPDPPTSFFAEAYEDNVEYDSSGVPFFPGSRTPTFCSTSLSLSIFRNLFVELPTAGSMVTTLVSPDDVLARLAEDFPIHARFDDVDVYETGELLVMVGGATGRSGGRPERRLKAIARRPIPIESVPGYLFGTDDRGTISSGMLGPAWFRRRQEEEQRRARVAQSPRWVSVLRRREAERPPGKEVRSAGVGGSSLDVARPPRGGQPPGPREVPRSDGGDDVPF